MGSVSVGFVWSCSVLSAGLVEVVVEVVGVRVAVVVGVFVGVFSRSHFPVLFL